MEIAPTAAASPPREVILVSKMTCALRLAQKENTMERWGLACIANPDLPEHAAGFRWALYDWENHRLTGTCFRDREEGEVIAAALELARQSNPGAPEVSGRP